MTRALIIASTLGLAIAWGCGSDSTPAKTDAKVFMDAPGSGSGSGSGSNLTVKNYLSWCSVTVGGGTASTAGTQTMPITAAGPITVKATAASATFEVSGNMWHHTDGDTGGSGETGTVTGTGTATLSTATVTVAVGANKCVWVCCPFSGGSGCNVAEQCP